MIDAATGQFSSATPTVTVSKDGAAFAASTNSPSAISSGTGGWDITFTASEMNTARTHVHISATGCFDQAFTFLPEPNYLAGLVANGGINLNLGQAIGRSFTNGTLGRLLHILRGRNGGKRVYDVTANTETVYDTDLTTVVQTFDMTPHGGNYTTKTPSAE